MMTKTDGAWVGWHGAPDEKVQPFSHGGMDLVPVQLSTEDVELFYEGFSNATLWPLYHDVIAPPEFHRTWWDSYRKVNRRFADAVVAMPATAPPSGCRTTSCSWSPRCSARRART